MGTSWTERRIRLNRCGTVLCERDWSWHPRPQTSGDFDLWFVWAGRGSVACEGDSVEVSPGSVFCLRPWLAYDATHAPDHRLGVCFLHFDLLSGNRVRLPNAADLPPHHCRLREVDLYERILRQAVALTGSTSDTDRSQAASLVRATLLAMQSAADAPADHAAREQHDRIRAVMRQVREQPGRIYSVEELAERAAYSVDHFTRLFREVAGTAPKEFCIRARLERAQVLLGETPMSVEQIAANLGYADVYFFSRQFKQRLGVPPTTWRRTGQRAASARQEGHRSL